jgi:hypothetical protein
VSEAIVGGWVLEEGRTAVVTGARRSLGALGVFGSIEFNSPGPGTRRRARFGLLVLKSRISDPKPYRRSS